MVFLEKIWHVTLDLLYQCNLLELQIFNNINNKLFTYQILQKIKLAIISELHQTLKDVIKLQLPAFPQKQFAGNLNSNSFKSQNNNLISIFRHSLEAHQFVILMFFKSHLIIQNEKHSKKQILIPFIDLNQMFEIIIIIRVLMFLLLFLAFVQPIPISDQIQSNFLNNLDKQEIKSIQTKEVFLLEIADFFQGTPFYNFLDLENKDNQTKRIVIATVLSIVLIVVLCVIIQFILDLAKHSNIQLSNEKKSNLSD